MPSLPLSDEALDHLLATRDPVDRSRLSQADIAARLDQLREVIVASPQPITRRSRGQRLRRPRVAVSLAIVGVLVFGLLLVSALLPGAPVRGGGFGPPPAAAAVALDHAARAAQRRPEVYPTARQYQYLAIQGGTISGYGEGGPSAAPSQLLWGVNVWESDTKQDWFKPNGSGRERIIEIGRGFLTPADRAIARAHHTSLDSILPNQSVDGTYPAGGIGWGYFNPAVLPDRASGLLAAIEREMRSKAGGHRPAAADEFDAISELLFDSDSPAQRAGLYRALAELPGVQLLGWRTDGDGRHGLAVSITRSAPRGAPQLRDELIFDPMTSEVLEQEQLLVAPYHQSGTPTLPTGTVMDYTVFLSRGIVDSIDDLPGGGRLPYHPSIGAETR